MRARHLCIRVTVYASSCCLQFLLAKSVMIAKRNKEKIVETVLEYGPWEYPHFASADKHNMTGDWGVGGTSGKSR